MKRIQFNFTSPDYVWIELNNSGCKRSCLVMCSAVADPFVQLFDWLEQIAEGAEHAVSHVDDEGQSSRLIFLAESTSLGGEHTYLLL